MRAEFHFYSAILGLLLAWILAGLLPHRNVETKVPAPLPDLVAQETIGRIRVEIQLMELGWAPANHTIAAFRDSNDALVLWVEHNDSETLFWRPCCSFSHLSGRLRARYWELGGPNGTLGMPSSRDYCTTPYCASQGAHRFDHGFIVSTSDGTERSYPYVGPSSYIRDVTAPLEVLDPIFPIVLEQGLFLRHPLSQAAPLPSRTNWTYQRFAGGAVIVDEYGREVK